MNNIDMVNDVNIAYEQVQKAAYCDLKGTNPVHIFLVILAIHVYIIILITYSLRLFLMKLSHLNL